MYNEYFGLQKAPFNLTPDPEFLYLTAKHREALAGLTYAIMGRKGFVVLTGDAGTGKTTLLTRILGYLPVTRIQSSVIVNPTLTPSEFPESTLLDFGFTEIPASKPQRIAALQSFLWKGHREGKISALVIDEAHKLSTEVLEEIRLLGNFESPGEKLLQIALVGQSELNELLDREHLRQFKQRIALRLAIEPLSAQDVKRYIVHRWTKAGGNEAPFTTDAFACIAEASLGIPRVINVICDNVLMEAFGEASATVELRHVIGVCRDLRLVDPAPRIAPPGVAPGPLDQPVPFCFNLVFDGHRVPFTNLAPEVLDYPMNARALQCHGPPPITAGKVDAETRIHAQDRNGMSKLFEIINSGKGEIADIVRPLVDVGDAPAPSRSAGSNADARASVPVSAQEITAFQSRLEAGPANEQHYAQLVKDYELASAKYQDLQQKHGVADAHKSMVTRKAGENLEVLDPASLPDHVTSPNRWLICGIGLGLGIVIGAALAGFREMKDTSLKNLKDVRAYTQMQILSSIPLLENDLLVQRRRRLAYLGWSTAVILGVLAATASVYYHFNVAHT